MEIEWIITIIIIIIMIMILAMNPELSTNTHAEVRQSINDVLYNLSEKSVSTS